MTTEVKVPQFPESVQEGTLSAWHKQPGDSVSESEKLADIETDKIVIEVTAPASGVVGTLLKQEGDTVLSQEVLCTLEAGKGTKAKEPEKTDRKAPAEPEPPPAPAEPEAKSTPPASEMSATSAASGIAVPAAARRAKPKIQADLGPSVRKLIAQHNLNPEEIRGTGRGGRITKADVLRFLEHSPHLSTKFGESQSASASVDIPPPPPKTPTTDEERIRRVKMSRLRARIAERLVEAQHHAALLTTFNDVDMQAVMDLRKKYKDAFEKQHGVKLGFMSFFVAAAVEALKKYPIINSSVDGEEILYYGYYNIGVAVSSDRGLVVPVVRDADQLSFGEIEAAIGDFSARAQAGKLDIEELSGGTFTISNGGVFGSMLSTPIINPPQSAILGMHRIEQRPVALNGEVVIRPMMYLALTYDHRIVDGRDAVLFLRSVKEQIEDPARLLLQL